MIYDAVRRIQVSITLGNIFRYIMEKRIKIVSVCMQFEGLHEYEEFFSIIHKTFKELCMLQLVIKSSTELSNAGYLANITHCITK